MNKPLKTFTTYPHRWGDGKIHRLEWSYENRNWFVACMREGGGFHLPHGEQTGGELEVTCKKCGDGGPFREKRRQRLIAKLAKEAS